MHGFSDTVLLRNDNLESFAPRAYFPWHNILQILAEALPGKDKGRISLNTLVAALALSRENQRSMTFAIIYYFVKKHKADLLDKKSLVYESATAALYSY